MAHPSAGVALLLLDATEERWLGHRPKVGMRGGIFCGCAVAFQFVHLPGGVLGGFAHGIVVLL